MGRFTRDTSELNLVAWAALLLVAVLMVGR
jgi:hypothetical protein